MNYTKTKIPITKGESLNFQRSYKIISGTFAVQFWDFSGGIGFLDFLTEGHISVPLTSENHKIICLDSGEVEASYGNEEQTLIEAIIRQRKLTEILLGKKTDYKIASFYYWWSIYQSTYRQSSTNPDQPFQEVRYFTHSDLSQIFRITRSTVTRFIIQNEQNGVLLRYKPNKKINQKDRKRNFINKSKFMDEYGYF